MTRILDEKYFWGDLYLPMRDYDRHGNNTTEELLVTSAEMLLVDLIDAYEDEALRYFFGKKFCKDFEGGFAGDAALTDKVKKAIYEHPHTKGANKKASCVADYVWLRIDNFVKVKRLQKISVQNEVMNTKVAFNTVGTERVKDLMLSKYCDTLNALLSIADVKYLPNVCKIVKNDVLLLNHFLEGVKYNLKKNEFFIDKQFNPYFI